MTWGIYLVSDLLYLIAFPVLYFALRQANRTVTLIAAIFNLVLSQWMWESIFLYAFL